MGSKDIGLQGGIGEGFLLIVDICNLSLCLLVIEVESSGYKIHASLDAFCLKYSSRIKERYLIYTKDFAREEETFYVPAYMTPLL